MINLQYISDSSGKITGVFIPILEWNVLKKKYEGIDLEAITIPDWHIQAVSQRLIEYKNNPKQALDFEAAIDDIEKAL